ncbi:Universal stress protein A-like protein [Linum perenne]
MRRWKDLLQLLEYFNTRSQQLGIACAYLIEKGDPKEAICREARRDRQDLLVLGCMELQ